MQVRGTSRQDGLRSSGADVQVQFGWYRQAKSGMDNYTEDEKRLHWEGLFHQEDRWHLASDTGDATILRLAIEDASPSVREAAAKNEHAPEDVLRRAFEDEAPYVRWEAVNNPSFPKDLVARGIDDNNGQVRLKSAEIAKDPDLLFRAMDDGFEAVRAAAAANPSAPESLLMKAMSDSELEVRRAAFGNPNATAAVKVEFLINFFKNYDDPDMNQLWIEWNKGSINTEVVKALIMDPRVDIDKLDEILRTSTYGMQHPMWGRMIARTKMQREFTPLVLITEGLKR